jgi:hypothetical protein
MGARRSARRARLAHRGHRTCGRREMRARLTLAALRARRVTPQWREHPHHQREHPHHRQAASAPETSDLQRVLQALPGFSGGWHSLRWWPALPRWWLQLPSLPGVVRRDLEGRRHAHR